MNTPEIQNKYSKSLFKKLMLFKKIVEPISKNCKGYGYKYGDLSEVNNKIKGPLQQCGLSYTHLFNMENDNYYVTTILIDIDTGDYIESSLYMRMSFETDEDIKKQNIEEWKKAKPIIQSLGANITYMKRYTLLGILGLVAEDDTDGQVYIKPHNISNTQTKEYSNNTIKLNSIRNKINYTLNKTYTDTEKRKNVILELSNNKYTSIEQIKELSHLYRLEDKLNTKIKINQGEKNEN